MENRFIYKGKNINYFIEGRGDAIVLLHGYLESGRIWEQFAGRLSDRFTLVCPDLPGHGNSGVYGETHSMEFMAETIKALVDYLGISRMFIAGHSMGGYVTLAFAEMYGGMLSGYCLMHSHPFADTPEAIEKRKAEVKLAHSGMKDTFYPMSIEKMYAGDNLSRLRSRVDKSKSIASGTPVKGIVAVLNGMMQRPSRAAVVETGNLPLLWILGAKDNFIPVSITERLKLPPNAVVDILVNSGHMGFIEEEDRTIQIFTGFLSGILNKLPVS